MSSRLHGVYWGLLPNRRHVLSNIWVLSGWLFLLFYWVLSNWQLRLCGEFLLYSKSELLPWWRLLRPRIHLCRGCWPTWMLPDWSNLQQ